MTVTTVAIATLGCRLNKAEAESWAWSLAQAGYRVVDFGPGADAYVVHTCTVTHVADRKSRQRLHQASRYAPNRVLGTGCFARRCHEDALAAGATAIVEKAERLVDTLCSLVPPTGGDQGVFSPHKGQAQVKVQEGCSLACTYCVIPRVRGRPRSRPVADVVAEVCQRAAQGYREVVMTGTLLGMYGKDLIPATDLGSLVRQVLTAAEGPRLRLSSLQPWDVTPELLTLWQSGRLALRFHLPLQSGSDAVLDRMGRCYNTEQYRGAVGLVRSVIPRAAITTDLIVGFPGETDAQFAESLSFCREMGVNRVHVFPYSARPGTRAAEMLDSVSPAIIEQRCRQARGLSLAPAPAASSY